MYTSPLAHVKVPLPALTPSFSVPTYFDCGRAKVVPKAHKVSGGGDRRSREGVGRRVCSPLAGARRATEIASGIGA